MSYDTNATLTLNNDPYPQQQQPTSSSLDAKQISKLILRSALQKANEAVQFDSTNNVLGAIQAYKEAITLLERVLATVEKENDRSRLQEIVSEAVYCFDKNTDIFFCIHSMTLIQKEFDF